MKNKTISTGLYLLLTIPCLATTFTKEAPDAGKWNSSLAGTWQFAQEDSNDYQPAPVPEFWHDPVAERLMAFLVEGIVPEVTPTQ